jgi:hypothetical protein
MYDGIIQFNLTQYIGVIKKKPKNVGTKNANKKSVFCDGNLNLVIAFFRCLNEKTMNMLNRIGSNKNN